MTTGGQDQETEEGDDGEKGMNVITMREKRRSESYRELPFTQTVRTKVRGEGVPPWTGCHNERRLFTVMLCAGRTCTALKGRSCGDKNDGVEEMKDRTGVRPERSNPGEDREGEGERERERESESPEEGREKSKQ